MAPRILVIEDHGKTLDALCRGLDAEGFETTGARSGEEGFFLAVNEPFDLVILDRMLPGREGLEILRALRREHVACPVLVVTARDSVADRVEGLEAGADDYVVKPFAFDELVARVRVLLRRRPEEPRLAIRADDLELDLVSRTVTREGQQVELTNKEFELLRYLALNRNSVVSRRMIAREVWKEIRRATPLDNVIDVHVARLRKKIDEPFSYRMIHTIRGVGFVLRTRGG